MSCSLAEQGNRQRGYVLVFVILFCALFCLLALSLLDISVLQQITLVDSGHTEQAFQLAWGGALLVTEEVYAILCRDFDTVEDISAGLLLPTREYPVPGENDMLIRVHDPAKISQDSASCTLEFLSEGRSQGAVQKLRLKVRYDFANYYTFIHGPGGEIVNMQFSHRVFLHHGKIVSLEYM